jgi:hypothetical protein
LRRGYRTGYELILALELSIYVMYIVLNCPRVAGKGVILMERL